ncbi:hypothetical protein CYMTET_35191, partial [Cymbomonas tetramitiformis]
MVRILGKEMILWVLDSLDLQAGDKVYIVYNPAFIDEKLFEQLVLTKGHHDVSFVHLAGSTRGAVETVFLGLQGVPEEERGRPTMCFDGDGFYTIGAIERYRAIAPERSAVFSYVDTDPRPLYSYVTIEGPKLGLNTIVDIKEKMKISDYANTGTYCFRSGILLETYCKSMIASSEAHLAQEDAGKFFTSGVIANMIADGEAFTMLSLNPGQFNSLGTPDLIKKFVSSWQSSTERKRFCFDLENTLIRVPTENDYANATPILENVSFCQRLYSQGHTIILQTSRVSADGNVEILQMLKHLSIPFHEIFFRKPRADFYIDDKAVFSGFDLAKELGFYDLSEMTKDVAPKPAQTVTDATISTEAALVQ